MRGEPLTAAQARDLAGRAPPREAEPAIREKLGEALREVERVAHGTTCVGVRTADFGGTASEMLTKVQLELGRLGYRTDVVPDDPHGDYLLIDWYERDEP